MMKKAIYVDPLLDLFDDETLLDYCARQLEIDIATDEDGIKHYIDTINSLDVGYKYQAKGYRADIKLEQRRLEYHTKALGMLKQVMAIINKANNLG